MGINNDAIFEEFSLEEDTTVETTPIKPPLPDEDFNRLGQVKKVRGRMLKKLLKCELKHFFPVMLGLTLLVIVLSLFFSVQLRVDLANSAGGAEYRMPTLLILSTTLYVVSLLALACYAFIAPIQRYENNFFKNEGYLTFSIPASMEEHVLAKRISSILCSLTAGAVAVFSFVLVCLIASDFSFFGEVFEALFEEVSYLYATEPVHAVLFTVEEILSWVVGLFTLPCVFGAGACLFSRFSRRRQMVVGFIIGFALISVVESVVLSLVSSGLGIDILQTMRTPVGIHVWNWVLIFFEAGIAVGCIFYELHFLKKKLDLK